eukprot:1879779-Karenia_brevis.AAC.1
MKRKYLSKVEHDLIESEFQEPPSPDDVVVLFKQNISDSFLCGVPVVCLPAGRAACLRGSVPSTAPRHCLNEKFLGELEKTADVIAKEPWCMSAGADYLHKFVCNNRSNTHVHAPPAISWILNTMEDWDGVIPPPNQCIMEDSLVKTRQPQRVTVTSGRAVRPSPKPKAAVTPGRDAQAAAEAQAA